MLLTGLPHLVPFEPPRPRRIHHARGGENPRWQRDGRYRYSAPGRSEARIDPSRATARNTLTSFQSIAPRLDTCTRVAGSCRVSRNATSGRGASHPTPPPQIPACSFPTPGSRRRSNAIVGLDAIDPQAHCFSDMLSPALSPEHALLLTFPSTGRLPPATSAADFSRLCSMLQRYYAAVRLLVCSTTASSPRLPVAARDHSASDCGPNEVSQVPTRSVRT